MPRERPALALLVALSTLCLASSSPGQVVPVKTRVVQEVPLDAKDFTVDLSPLGPRIDADFNRIDLQLSFARVRRRRSAADLDDRPGFRRLVGQCFLAVTGQAIFGDS